MKIFAQSATEQDFNENINLDTGLLLLKMFVLDLSENFTASLLSVVRLFLTSFDNSTCILLNVMYTYFQKSGVSSNVILFIFEKVLSYFFELQIFDQALKTINT